jgi:thioredoxin reductase
MQDEQAWDVIIVGAGAAGIGCAIVLHDLGVQRFTLLERHAVGASFARWPAEMRFITPSFMSNHFGMLDLNAVALGTSPAHSLQREHPSGPEYAEYLQALAAHWELPVQSGMEVHGVEPRGEGFLVHTSEGAMRSRFVVWAAGEFQYPRLHPFAGAEHCLHNSQVRSWAELEGDEFIVIGGYESGIDAAVSLCALGKRVRVLDGAASWESDSVDPSLALSPYTVERLEVALATGRVQLIGDAWVTRVEHSAEGYTVCTEDEQWTTPTAPILATGFEGSLRLVRELFEWNEAGQARLTSDDESTITPGLFVVGPAVRHEQVIFCFIYKFRQRFAVVARCIAERMGLDITPLNLYRQQAMFLEDLSGCDEDCVC